MRTFGHRKNVTQRRRSRLKEAPRKPRSGEACRITRGREEAGSRLPCVCRVSRHLDLDSGLQNCGRAGRPFQGSAVQTALFNSQSLNPGSTVGPGCSAKSVFRDPGCSLSQTRAPLWEGSQAFCPHTHQWAAHTARVLPSHELESPRSPRRAQGFAGRVCRSPRCALPATSWVLRPPSPPCPRPGAVAGHSSQQT